MVEEVTRNGECWCPRRDGKLPATSAWPWESWFQQSSLKISMLQACRPHIISREISSRCPIRTRYILVTIAQRLNDLASTRGTWTTQSLTFNVQITQLPFGIFSVLNGNRRSLTSKSAPRQLLPRISIDIDSASYSVYYAPPGVSFAMPRCRTVSGSMTVQNIYCTLAYGRISEHLLLHSIWCDAAKLIRIDYWTNDFGSSNVQASSFK